MNEQTETVTPEPESRQVRRARERKAEKDKKRRADLAGAPIKKQRRTASLRGDVKMVKRTIGGMLLELRNMVADIQQKADLQNVLNECLTRCALGKGTEEETEVLEEYLADCDKTKVEEKPPGQEPPAEMGETVFTQPEG